MYIKGKYEKIVLAGLLLASGLMAEDRKVFVGAEIGKFKGSYSNSTSEWSGDSKSAFGIKAGVVGKQDRIYLSYIDVAKYEYVPLNRTEDCKAFLLNLEAMTEPYKLTNSIAPQIFAGGHAGMVKVNATSGTATATEEDWLYGAQAGILLNLTNNISIEAGYRYSWSSLAVSGVHLDSVNGYYGGLNFSF
jgi:opacity protein-like surface antigen